MGRLRDVVGVVTVGQHGDLDAFGPQPSHVHITRYIPQATFFPTAPRWCLMAARARCSAPWPTAPAGLPAPRGRPVRNAQACAAAGAGIALIGSDASTDRIKAALRRVLNDPSLRRNAERLATEIADMPSLEDAVTALEQWG